MKLQRQLSGGKCPSGYEKGRRKGYCRKSPTTFKTPQRYPVSKIEKYLDKTISNSGSISLAKLRKMTETEYKINLSTPEYKERFKSQVQNFYRNSPSAARKCGSSYRSIDRYTKEELVNIAKKVSIVNPKSLTVKQLCTVLQGMGKIEFNNTGVGTLKQKDAMNQAYIDHFLKAGNRPSEKRYTLETIPTASSLFKSWKSYFETLSEALSSEYYPYEYPDYADFISAPNSGGDVEIIKALLDKGLDPQEGLDGLVKTLYQNDSYAEDWMGLIPATYPIFKKKGATFTDTDYLLGPDEDGEREYDDYGIASRTFAMVIDALADQGVDFRKSISKYGFSKIEPVYWEEIDQSTDPETFRKMALKFHSKTLQKY